MNIKTIISILCPAFLRPSLAKIENSPISYRIVKGTFWSISGTVISRGLMLGASILVARILGRSEYGELGMIRTTINMFGVLAGFGLGLTATKYVAEFRKTDPERAGRILGLSGLFAALTGGLMAAVLFICSPWLTDTTINAPHLAGILKIGAIILFLNALNGAQTGALSGFEAFKTIARVNLFVGIISFPILVSGAYLGGLKGSVWALLINLIINWLLNHIALRREAKKNFIPFTFKNCIYERSILWKFSLPAALGSCLVGPVNWACCAMLVNKPEGYSEMGIFNAANQWFNVLLFLPGMIGSVILPVLSDQLGRNNIKSSIKTLIISVKINLLIVAPLVLIASITSPYIMGLYGDDFINGWPTFVAVMFTALLLAVQRPVGQIISASGRMWTGLSMNGGWALVFIITAYLLTNYGSFGLASARAIAYIVHSLWTLIFAIWFIRKGTANE